MDRGPKSRKCTWFSFRLFVVGAFALTGCLLLAGCSGVSGSTSSGNSGSPSGSGTGGGTGSGTGGGTTGGGTGQGSAFVYVSETSQSFGGANAAGTMSGIIEAFTLNESSGTLSPISGSPFSTTYSTGGDMAIAPGGGYAYVLAQQFPSGSCCVGPTFLLVFSLDATTGAPTLRQAVATGAIESSSVAVHPSGKFVYISPYNGTVTNGGVGIFSVQSDGTLALSAVAAAQSTGSVVIDPNGSFLYTSSDGNPVAPLGNNPCGLFYSDLWGFSINPTTGALTPIGGSPFVFQRQLCQVGHAPNYITKLIDAQGQRLFTVDAFNAVVNVFSIDSSGALTQLPGSSSDSSVAGLTSAGIDPQDRFLYIGSTVDFFTGFLLTSNQASGSLPRLAGMPVQATPLPNFDEGSTTMAIDPSGSFLFSNENGYTSAFSCCGPDALVEFQINAANGGLTQVAPNRRMLTGAASRIAATPGK